MSAWMRTSVAPAKAGVLLVLIVLLAACGVATHTPEPDPPALDRSQAIDLAWAALEPNTASHVRANWAVVEARRALGQSVAGEFEGWAFYANCGGPEPPPNGEIEPADTYWYVEMEPQPATPSGPSMSPTAPPLVPEPFMVRAAFLIDDGGQVIARVLVCIAY